METTEKVVEAYVRYVKGWATIPNIKCPGQYEIDILAIDPKSCGKYHIECGISLPGPFAKLTAKPYDKELIKVKRYQAAQRRTLGYFAQRKFNSPGVVETLAGYGFEPGEYQKIIVSWGWASVVEDEATAEGIELWHFADILMEIAETLKKTKVYFTDDTLRTLQLFSIAKNG
ncbi:hypothetical protein KP003_02785 [Geomonas nitrogeniifigens]|uniref:hypothetical protein n=1 Tax=Geomonas diazotrophica TaxID=2843197 RepID=UPI001C2C482F|nr:hypothetical protein [Geomonas nitrogeniifigens]QXE87350.1 hypothetical protein KP003_02785 [Geomonas nitrogeniifigens]